MMAELAAIGLVSNIVGFIDFGLKLFREGKEIYESAEGANVKQLDLEIITLDLKRLMEELQPTSYITKDDAAIAKLALHCRKLADELLCVLAKLKIKEGTGKNRKWRSFRQALKGVLKENDIQLLETRIEKFQKQLGQRLLYTLSHQNSTVLWTIRNLQDENRRLGFGSTSKLNEIMDHLVKQAEQAKEAKEEDSVDYAQLNENLKLLAEEGKRATKRQTILRRLCFSSIKVRHDLIKQAHTKTFTWIFDDLSSTFNKWLQSGDGMYWVQGKAGSGKSTLMRFVSEHSACKSALNIWAGGCRLVIGSYFFWNAGNSMQKSQSGLLQTLLYQVCRECPTLIEQIFPVRWQQEFEEFELPWTRTELFEAFERLSDFSISSTRFCFFIDGLDEYSGDHQELVLLMNDLSKLTSIKLCVSSRPWNIFQNSFSQNSEQQLKLEDLTRDDIRKYVRNHLEENPKFQLLQSSDSGYQKIVGDIVARAHGVFLWVYLVVDSLSKGLSNNDSIVDMQRRLNEFPGTLEKYFKHMIDNIEPFYREDTIQFFEIAVHALQPLPLLAFKFVQDEKERRYGALNTPIRPYSDIEIDEISMTMKLRLNARCGDLLEVTKDTSENLHAFKYKNLHAFKYKIDFLHRTVRDFFLKTDTMDTLRQGESDFNVQVSLCKVMIALLKILPHIERKNTSAQPSSTWQYMFSLSDQLMYHAHIIEQHFDKATDDDLRREVAMILGELDRVNSEISSSTQVHWSNARKVPRGLFTEYNQKTFLAATIQAKLTLYVQEVLKPSDIRDKKGRPLLDYALRPNMVTPIELPDLEAKPEYDMVRLLVERGADINKKVYIYENKSVWRLFLEQCYGQGSLEMRLSEEESKNLLSIIELLIKSGADPNYTFVANDGKTIGPSGVFKAFLTRRDFVALEELLLQKRQGSFSIWKLIGWT
ncbi:hypothetical protein HYFRA_00010154 [Hymenoscyphus fraxineus]|uniref:NACHT domain-containing protein n=1 Tax=Hymenoscyphus fraxineus TaxID=746836 RepID=A0A9N9PNE4_9HELO|nr:hypothetical protein HYFRA_00010154 [Hymenoscyphus fraxineus]